MKLSEATFFKAGNKPFIDNETLKLQTLEEANKITGFEVTLKATGTIKTFDVKNQNILKAWQEVEVYLKGLK